MTADKLTDERPWELTSSYARPKDGEKAEVLDGRRTMVVVFRAEPIARWESMDGSHVYDFTFFKRWRRV